MEAAAALTSAAAGDLVVGFPNPNEIREINTDIDVEGNVLIVNNGVLRMNGARLRVQGSVHVFNGGKLEVLGGTLVFVQDYLYQYGLTAMNTSAIWLNNSVVQCGGFNISCGVADTAALRIDGSSFSGGIMTTTLADHASVEAAGSQRVGELLFFDSATGSFSGCDGLLTWLTLPAGSTLDATTPGAQVLGSWHFPDSARQHAGYDYRVAYSGCTNLLWGLMLEPGCTATLRDSDLLAVGAMFRGSGAGLVSGLVNNAIPRSYTYPAQDRDVQFEDCAVQVWNLYALDNYQLSVRSCIIGEVLAMGSSDVVLQSTICDGTGGYAGARDQATMLFIQSQITSPVIARDQAQLTLLHSSLQSHTPHAADNGVIALFHSSFPALPTVEAGAAAVVMGLDDPAQAETERDVALFGTVRFIGGSELPIHFISFWFDAVREDNPDDVLFTAGPSIRERYRDTLGIWDTRGHVPGNHLLRLHMRISTGDTISLPSVVRLVEGTVDTRSLPAAFRLQLAAWPNPLRGRQTLTLRVQTASPGGTAVLTMTDLLGRPVLRRPVKDAAVQVLRTDELPAGSYLLQLREGRQTVTRHIQILP